MKAGEEKEGISVELPEEHPLRKISGGKVVLKVKIESVQNVEFPEIDDNFAKSLGKFDNLSALKKNIEEGIHPEKKEAESQRIREEILKAINDKTECGIPDVL